MAPGHDRDSGSGIVMAWEALNFLGTTGFANPQLGTIAASENPGNGNGVIEAGEGGQVVIQLSNTSGVVDATGITATLTTATPGVTITLPGTSSYPDLAAGSGVANNLSPFTFTVASNAACALTVDFTLTVNYTGRSAAKLYVQSSHWSGHSQQQSWNSSRGFTGHNDRYWPTDKPRDAKRSSEFMRRAKDLSGYNHNGWNKNVRFLYFQRL